MPDVVYMLPSESEPARTLAPLRACTAYPRLPSALQHWKGYACLAAAVAGVLGTAALISLVARSSADPAQDSPEAREVGSASHWRLKDGPEVPGVGKLRGAQPPGEGRPAFPAMPELDDMPELPPMPEFPEMPAFPEVPEIPMTPELAERIRKEFPEMPELPETPELVKMLRKALNSSDEVMKAGIPGMFAVPRDANSKVQSLVDAVKRDVFKMTSSMDWNVDLAPFKALTFCQEADGSPVTVVKVQIGGGQIAQLTIVLQGGTALLLSMEAVQAGDRSCLGNPAIKNATKEVQNLADSVKAEVPALLGEAGWEGFDIEPFRAISHCGHGTHLVVRLAVHDRSAAGVDLQLRLHVQPGYVGRASRPLISGAEIVKSDDKRCVGEPVKPATGLPRQR